MHKHLPLPKLSTSTLRFVNYTHSSNSPAREFVFRSPKIFLPSVQGGLWQPHFNTAAASSEPWSSYFQIVPGVEIPQLSGQPVPIFDHSHSEKNMFCFRTDHSKHSSHTCLQRRQDFSGSLASTELNETAQHGEVQHEASVGVLVPHSRDLWRCVSTTAWAQPCAGKLCASVMEGSREEGCKSKWPS